MQITIDYSEVIDAANVIQRQFKPRKGDTIAISTVREYRDNVKARIDKLNSFELLSDLDMISLELETIQFRACEMVLRKCQ